MVRGDALLDRDGPPRRVLLVRLSHLGDVVQALPVFHALRAMAPEAEIGWAVQPEFDSLLDGLPGLARRFHFARREGLGAWTRLAAELGAFAPELAVDAQGNLKSAMVALASGAPRRVGLARCDWTERFGSHVLTERAPASAGRHAMERSLALARHLAPGARPRFDPALSPAERERGRAELHGRLPAGSGPAWLLHLAAPADVRSWPPEHFAELALRLAAAGARVLLVSGPAEEPVGRALAADPRLARAGVAHWVGQRGLRAFAALAAAAAEARCALVACDSGPAHLAAAVGMEVHLLAGPQDPARTGPWAAPGRAAQRALRRADPPDCMPCLARTCAYPRGPVCMQALAPERVAAELLGGPAGPEERECAVPAGARSALRAPPCG